MLFGTVEHLHAQEVRSQADRGNDKDDFAVNLGGSLQPCKGLINQNARNGPDQ